jgi:hypothetical protein
MIVLLGRVSLELKIFSHSAQNSSLAFTFSVEKSAVILMGLPLYIVCFSSQTGFNVLSLFFMTFIVMIICCEEVLFWSSLFGVLEAFCT